MRTVEQSGRLLRMWYGVLDYYFSFLVGGYTLYMYMYIYLQVPFLDWSTNVCLFTSVANTTCTCTIYLYIVCNLEIIYFFVCSAKTFPLGRQGLYRQGPLLWDGKSSRTNYIIMLYSLYPFNLRATCTVRGSFTVTSHRRTVYYGRLLYKYICTVYYCNTQMQKFCNSWYTDNESTACTYCMLNLQVHTRMDVWTL